jgi:hypothetical protein
VFGFKDRPRGAARHSKGLCLCVERNDTTAEQRISNLTNFRQMSCPAIGSGQRGNIAQWPHPYGQACTPTGHDYSSGPKVG